MQVKGRVSPQGLILQRQIVTDTGGRLLRVHVHPANVHDRWGGKALLEGLELRHWPRVRKVYVDFGYRGLRREAEGLGLELEVVAHPLPETERVKGFKPLPKRWVVERTFAWMGRNRRLGKNYEYHPEVTEAWMYLGMIRLLVKRLASAA
ncbi:hypothetical protein CSW47_16270 [Thermus scotoductus]|uniref:Transposase IS4-like domain-containing protein n=1 Tax=Thermus scotoductus TaxID=37636 RepID=A0A430QW01_THESC|nr:hypothetical protein CSW47_16270 [Thermus scotoductus]